MVSAANSASWWRRCGTFSALACVLAFTTLNGGAIHKATAFRTSDTEGGQLITASSALQGERQAEASVTDAGSDANVPWMKTLAAGVTSALVSVGRRGGANAFQIHAHGPAAPSGVRSSTTALQLSTPYSRRIGTPVLRPEMPAFSIMTMETAQPVLEQEVRDQQRVAGNQSTVHQADSLVRIGRKIVTGRTAEVFEATYFPEGNSEESLDVAVKKIPRTPEAERRIQREIRMMWELEAMREPDFGFWPFPRFYGFEDHADVSEAWVVMEIADGDLESLVLETPMSEVTFLDRIQIIKELTIAVAMMNRRGFLHLDIKPQNVFIKKEVNEAGEEEFKVKLGDFGLCCSVGNSSETLRWSDTEKLPGGSWLYMAPERFAPELFFETLRRDLPSPALKSDVFSIGMIFYQLMFQNLVPLSSCDYMDAFADTSQEFPGTGWSASFDIRDDPLFKHARAAAQVRPSDAIYDRTNASAHLSYVSRVLFSKVLDVIEASLSQNVERRPDAEWLLKEGWMEIEWTVRATQLDNDVVVNMMVDTFVGDIIRSVLEDDVLRKEFRRRK